MSQPGATPPPLPPQEPSVLPYAVPLGMQQPVYNGFWRRGDQLVTTRNASLPHTCVKCNQPADGQYKSRDFYWLHPLWFLLILAGVLVFAIVAIIIRKKATISVGLCASHARKRLNLILLTWLLSLGGIAAMIAGPVAGASQRPENPVLILGGLLGGLAMIIVAVIVGNRARPLTPVKIDEHYAYFKGAAPEFLAPLHSV